MQLLGHESGNNTTKPISSNGINKLKTPTSKTKLIRFIGSMNLYSKFINKLHISLKPFYTAIYDDTSFELPSELDKVFNEMKTSLEKKR